MTQLRANGLQFAAEVNNRFSCIVESGTPIETVLTPQYWAHNSVKLRRGDLIEAKWEDETRIVELRVVDVGRLYAKVKVRIDEQLESVEIADIDLPEGYTLRWRGPRRMWGVICGNDCLKDGMEKSVALSWALNHAKAA